MKYVSKQKDQFAENEYSAEVKRIPDEDLQGFLDAGWVECAREQWLLVQSPEVLAVADTEYADEPVAPAAPAAPAEPVSEGL